ncbi:MAG: alpha/beta hydrolase [Beijerinckiaceae bacterium]
MSLLKWIGRLVRWGLTATGLFALAAGSLLAVPVSPPPELASIRAGALAIDRAGLPEPSRFYARDGSHLAYRFYPAADGGTEKIAIVIHGSGEGSAGMNQIAKQLAAQNFIVVAPDIRGHGGSGTRGDIGYFGQLDDDLEDLVVLLRRQFPNAHFGLLGFSSGGGFALRIASGKLASNFNRLVLVSPYLNYDAPSTRSPATSARWANADVPRIIALAILRGLGLRCCEDLPVVAFAVAPGSEKFVTAQYSYRLMTNFAAPPSISTALHDVKMPATIIAGGQDELMDSAKYADIVRGIEPKIDVQIVPGLGHMDMLHTPAAIDAMLAAFKE